jgi:protoporphyrinogen oxidase
MKKVVIIGAGPSGLAAGSRLSEHGISPLILEKEGCVGGLSRTIEYKGFRFDIGGHRFYTQNKSVLSWWKELLKDDFLKIPRKSKIYYQKTFFEYPISITNVLTNIGLVNAFLVPFSYLRSRLFPHEEESNLEQWIINRFGSKLYQIFFKEYTQKVWGLSCRQISADWASQRIKGLSLSAALRNALSKGRKNKVKTLLKEFYFPRLGAGMMYEAADKKIKAKGGETRFYSEVVGIRHNHTKIESVVCKDSRNGRVFEVEGSDFCSSMPLTALVCQMEPAPDENVLQMCRKLRYRSMILVYFIVGKKDVLKDNWIYINSTQVKVARIQNFKKWSPDMLADSGKSSLGLEYFCDEADQMWQQRDEALITLAKAELEKLKICKREDFLDALVERVPKAYPMYELGYRQPLGVLKNYLSRFSNLHCIGRYGMFHYNNMDQSALSGFLAAENILGARRDLWSVNLEEECND